MDGETDSAFAAFQMYLSLGSTRSVRRAAVECSKRNRGSKKDHRLRGGAYVKWAAKFRWVERARAYDDHMAKQAHAAKEEATREWITELVEANKEVLRLVYRRIKEVLSLPSTRHTVTKQIEVAGQTVDQYITIEGANYRLSELASILEKTDKIMRLFMGDPTERFAANVKVGLALLTGKDIDDALADPAAYAALEKLAENVANRQSVH